MAENPPAPEPDQNLIVYAKPFDGWLGESAIRGQTPRQVRGMVLVDPAFPDQYRRGDRVAPRFMAFTVNLHDQAMFELVPLSSRIVVNKKRNYGAMPIRILTAATHQPFPADVPGDAAAEWPRFEEEWRRAHDEMAALSTDGTNRIVEGSSHYIQDLKPDAVIAAVDEVIDKARAVCAMPQIIDPAGGAR